MDKINFSIHHREYQLVEKSDKDDVTYCNIFFDFEDLINFLINSDDKSKDYISFRINIKNCYSPINEDYVGRLVEVIENEELKRF